MSLFTDASLVLVPSGIKNQKIYSVKPTDGSGDLTFSRASNATRVNSSGLVEKVRTNELTYSNDFSNAAWTKVRATLTGGQSDPFGGTDAWRMECSGSTGSVQIAQNANIGNGSIYAKAGNVSSFNIWVGLNVTFDLSTGTITSGAANGKIESVGGGWYRCTAINPSATVHNPNFTAASLGEYVYIAFAQGESGGIATDYIATTSSAVSVGPVSGLPRLDYSGGASCPKLLLEGTRTNLVLWSEQMDNAAWDKADVTVTANTTISPDGYQNADTVTATAEGQRINQSITVSASTVYTFSFYAKKGTMVTPRYSVYDLSNGAFILTQVDYSSLINSSTWTRITATFTTPSGCTSIGIYPVNGATTGTIFIWGAMLEQGSYSSSYLNTLSTAVTRVAESASKTGVSSLIGSTAGTLYSEFIVNGFADYGTPLCVNNGTTSESIWLTTFANGDIRAEVFSNAGGGIQATFIKSGNVTGQVYKIAIGYASNNFAFYVNGTQVGSTDLSGSVPVGMNRIDFDYNNSSLFVKSALSIKQALLFPTRLSNADLATLTTI